MKTTGINIHEFIKNHKHTGYFEAIMYPDGTLEYASPSHTMKLCEIYDDTKTIRDISNFISKDTSPLEWLLYQTKCIAIWTSTLEVNSQFQLTTEEQKKSLIILFEQRLITFNPEIIIDIYIQIIMRCFKMSLRDLT